MIKYYVFKALMKAKKKGATFFKYFLIAMLAFMVVRFGVDMATDFFHDADTPRYTESHEGPIVEDQYIISKEMVLSSLQAKAELVSYEQDLFKVEEHHDKSLFGQRVTELTMKGSYKMGLDTADITVTHIDNQNGTVYVELPKPKVISMDVPYDRIEFDKEQGWFRLAMSEEEQKNFYRSAINSMRNELNTDPQILQTANLYNQEVVRDLILKVSNVKRVVFTEGDWK